MEVLAVLVLGLTVAVMVELGLGFRKLPCLDACAPDPGAAPPVSIIVPACNEEGTIEAGLRSLAGQDYRRLEIIVVNDRSTDRTGEVIEAVRSDFPRIRRLDVRDLPAGWLGKPHALHTGAAAAGGELLVFTDADVTLEPTTISRAVAAIDQGRFDHLALVFKNSTGGSLLNALVADIGAGLLWLIKPWRAAAPKSRYFVGVGAFNMVRAGAYRAIGGHRHIRLQVIDDLFLGKLVKRHGFRQGCLRAQGFVSVPWYRSVDELIGGLMKNVYSFFNYRLSYLLPGLAALLVVVLLPYGGVLFCSGPARLIFLAAVAVRVAGIGAGLILSGVEKGAVVWLLATPFIVVYIIVRAAAVTIVRGGISWRAGFYPLAELKEQEWVLSGLFPAGPVRPPGREKGL